MPNIQLIDLLRFTLKQQVGIAYGLLQGDLLLEELLDHRPGIVYHGCLSCRDRDALMLLSEVVT